MFVNSGVFPVFSYCTALQLSVIKERSSVSDELFVARALLAPLASSSLLTTTQKTVAQETSAPAASPLTFLVA
jgi:hypothetical protein